MATMNARVLGAIVFVLVPSLALAQSAGETLVSVNKLGIQAS